MTTTTRNELVAALPYARRYARALSGNQARGDALVAESVKEILAGGNLPRDARCALYACVTRSFERSAVARRATGTLTGKQRQLLLLTSLEEMSVDQAAPVVALKAEEARLALSDARDKLRSAAATDVLIIEDEPIIAMDIEELVQSCGHRVVGTATTERDAVALAAKCRPGLILADINLGVGGDGANAVARIQKIHPVPVIFVTAYPERLLTGEDIEPAFVITKPFEPMTLAVATFQAVTGGVQLD